MKWLYVIKIGTKEQSVSQDDCKIIYKLLKERYGIESIVSGQTIEIQEMIKLEEKPWWKIW